MSHRRPEEIAALSERVAAGWKARGARLTVVRRIVAEAAFALREPFRAEELLAQARRVDRAISAASVYRILTQLQEMGVVREVPSARGHRNFSVIAAEGTGVSHVICKDCSQVIAIPDPCLPLREGALARQHGFSPKAMTLRVEATCDELQATGVCARRRGATPA